METRILEIQLKNMTKKFIVTEDPGHSWISVKANDLQELGLRIEDFTEFSYKYSNGKRFYLEMTVDGTLFLEKYKAKFGELPAIEERVLENRSGIRNLPRIHE